MSLFLGGESRSRFRLGLDDAVADIFDEKGEEQAGHEDSRRGPLVAEFAEAFVAEHERGMSEELARESAEIAHRAKAALLLCIMIIAAAEGER